MILPDSVVHFMGTFLAGGTSAAIALTTIAPLERVKLILQIQKSASHISADQEYKGIIDCLVRIPKEQGFLSFWRGNWAGIMRSFPYQAFNFSFKELFKQNFIPESNNLWIKLLGNVVSGGVAGAFALTVIYPLDYARTRMAMDIGGKKNRYYKGVSHCLGEVWRHDGLRAIYRGYFFAVFGAFIYRSMYFGLFDTTMETVSPEYSHSLWVEFTAAEVSATIAGFVSYPLDTVRRRMMVQHALGNMKAQKTIRYTSTFHCWNQIWINEGARGFYHGGLVNVYRGTGGAIMLVLYDNIQRWLFSEQAHLSKYLPSKHHQRPTDPNLDRDPFPNETTPSPTDKPCKVVKDRGVFCNF